MKKTMKYLSMAALALVGALTAGCSSDDFTAAPQQPANKVVTLTTTIGLDNATRALTLDDGNKQGVKTFETGEKVAIIYTNTSNTKVTAEYTIQDGDVSTDHKYASLTFALTDPKAGDVTLVYPASLADKDAADGISMTALQTTQDGTFDKLASDFDAATATDQMTVSGTTATLSELIALDNPLTIAKLTLKESGSAINNTLTRVIISDGTNTYTVNRTASAEPIYVAMKPIANDKTITISAANGTDGYERSVTGKALAANKIYPINVAMTKTFEGRATPLTLEMIAAGTINFENNASSPVKYKVNGGEAQTIAAGLTGDILVNAGDKVSFYGKNETYYTTSSSHIYCDYDS